mmetsp:Transcript_5589/g.18813  ORF Transcript_5589/g.18813 Transcript_5589/m.18813 type:complete len:261 (+) Transcript_5589:2617-3399(+)
MVPDFASLGVVTTRRLCVVFVAVPLAERSNAFSSTYAHSAMIGNIKSRCMIIYVIEIYKDAICAFIDVANAQAITVPQTSGAYAKIARSHVAAAPGYAWCTHLNCNVTHNPPSMRFAPFNINTTKFTNTGIPGVIHVAPNACAANAPASAHHVVPNAPSAARIKSNTYATMSPTNTIVIDVSPPLATVTHNAGMSPTLALALCPHARAFDSLARIRILIIFIVFPVSTLRRRVVVVVIALLYIYTHTHTHPLSTIVVSHP